MTSPQSPERQELRTRTLRLIASIALFHGVMIGLYYLLHINLRPDTTQQTYVAVWVVLSLGVILPQMKGIRALRRRRR
jgi:hypothetical protein